MEYRCPGNTGILSSRYFVTLRSRCAHVLKYIPRTSPYVPSIALIINRSKAFLAAGVLLSACTPHPIFMSQQVEGSPEFQAGFKDGCQSGFATYAPAHYKIMYPFYQNYRMLKNKDYNAAWHEGFDYCRHYTLSWFNDDF